MISAEEIQRQQGLRDRAEAATASSFWIAVLAVWLVLFAIAACLTLALAIWKIIEAF